LGLGEVLNIRGEVRTIEIKGPGASIPWKVNVVNTVLELPRDIEKELTKIVEKTVQKFPKEKTYAQEKYNVHSLLIRVDFTISEEGVKIYVIIYEVEDSPAGIGIAILICPGFREKLFALEWPKQTKVFIYPPREKGGDDYLWTEVILDPTKLTGDFLIAPRIDGFQDIAHIINKIRDKSIWPIQYRKSKSYGVGWLWEEIKEPTPENIEKLANTYANANKLGGIVFKSDGSKTEKVRIVLFKRGRKMVQEWLGVTHNIGTWSLGTIIKEVSEWNPLYVQPLYFPIKVRLNGANTYGIYRIYFAFDPQKRTFNAIGGFLNIRKSLLIHGATDAFFVPVVPSK